MCVHTYVRMYILACVCRLLLLCVLFITWVLCDHVLEYNICVVNTILSLNVYFSVDFQISQMLRGLCF